MIMLIAKNTLIEGKQKEFTELAEKLVLATRKEAGCIAYDLGCYIENVLCRRKPFCCGMIF